MLRTALLCLGFIGLGFLGLGLPPAGAQTEPDIPHLREHGAATHLIVDGEPFLILGGELGNSTASSLTYLDAQWETLETLNLNTVLAPVSWELIEPVEGQFDFTLVDGMLEQARAHDMRLVILWFGAWKNSMSSYVPAWVKRDQARFPRARDAQGRAQDILSPFYDENREADRRAFTALMAHLREADSRHRTVLMVQVENEIGMLPDARDHSEAANAAFAEPVPLQIRSAQEHPDQDWESLFGASAQTDEMFQAWHFARYVEALAASGKAEYPLPMFVNAALNRPGVEPGGYPSAGPLPHLFEIWQAGAPSLDFLAPDIYFPNFVERISEFRTPDNPLFIPEANRAGRGEATADALFAFGALDAMGFSPFSIENAPDPEHDLLGEAYAHLAELAPLVLERQGTDRLTGFRPPVSYSGELDAARQSFEMGGYRFTVTFDDPWTPDESQAMETHGGLLMQLGEDAFLVLGHGVTLTFETADGSGDIAGIESIWEGRYAEGAWQPGRLLNGDESHQGRHLRLPPGSVGLQRLRLYRYN